jgi:hypothetical protein
MPGLGLRGLERGHDKAWVGRTAGPLGLANDATPAAPAVPRRPGEVAEASGWLTARFGFDARCFDFCRDLGGQPLVARQPEQIIDPVVLAPRHQRFSCKSTVGAQQNAHARPAGTDAADNAPDLVHRARGGVDVRAAQLGCEQMATAEHVQRQIAVTVVVAVEEPAFLVPVQWIVGRIEIERNLCSGALRCASRKRSMNSASIAAASAANLL